MAFTLPELNYDYSDLEPYIDGRTMKIHHTRHHATYLNKFNEAIEDTPLENKTPTEIFNEVSKYDAEVRNNGGGFYNHSLFWKFLSPEKKQINDVYLSDGINKYFGTFENMKREFSEVAIRHFGSGWTWLIKRNDGELIISSTPNQDNPLMDVADIQGTPILCLDVWEHAYYLQYQNDKESYVQAFWNIVNWDLVTEIYHR